MLAIKVPLRHINELRKILMDKEIIAKNYKIHTEDRYGYIPINSKLDLKTQQAIENELLNKNLSDSYNSDLKEKSQEKFEENFAFEIVEKDLEELKKQPKSISEHLKGKLNEKEIEELKTSFDIIGDTVILEIPENLQEHKDLIGEAALNFTKRKSVFMKKSAVEGVTRTRQLEQIAGENNPITIHKEHGVRLKLNIREVYFSPRLATERLRVSKQVKEGEIILDMFAGIGPFPILIAKNHKVDIYATDINKEAINYMKQNIELNKLKGKIYPILGDINKVANEKFKKENIKFDRIIMNLPGTAKDFLELAISLINNNGIIHYYEFSDSYDTAIERIEKIAKNYNKKIEVLATRKVKSSSPGQWHIVVDAKLINL